DAIRYSSVTGVQTCALPISTRQSGNLKHTSARYSARHRSCFMQLAANHQVDQTIASKLSDWFGADFVSIAQHCNALRQGKHLLRSEERRVGKDRGTTGRRTG